MSTEKQTAAQRKAEQYRLCVAAFERLVTQEPENDELRERLEEDGFIAVTQDSVAKEAGVSRKALTGGGKFKELGARIKAVRSSHGVQPSTTAQLDQLRTDLGDARQTIVVLRSKMAEAIVRADRAEASLKGERQHVMRIRQQLAETGAHLQRDRRQN